MTENKVRLGFDIGHTVIHTINIKIAISIPEDIFRQVKKAAEQQNRSPSEVIVEALREHFKKLESRNMFDSLNEVYSSPDTEEERATRKADLDLYKRAVLEREKW